MNYKELILEKEYDFLREYPLGDKIILLNIAGSRAYGTSLRDENGNDIGDIDLRGITHNTVGTLLGSSQFEMVERTSNLDTVIYSLNKIFSLLKSCNPNCIELLDPSGKNNIIISDVGRQIIANRRLFLSKIAAHSFGGYANSQLRRLQNALARDNYNPADKEKHIQGSIENMMYSFNGRYASFENGSISLKTKEAKGSDLSEEIVVDVNLKDYPLRDYKSIWSDMNNIVKDYSKLSSRNKKKDTASLNKHAMHLVRLYLMCFDILENYEIVTYRENDRDLLLAIRNGDFMTPEENMKPEFFTMVDDFEKRLKKLSETSKIPEKPNVELIDRLLIDINYNMVKEEFNGNN